MTIGLNELYLRLKRSLKPLTEMYKESRVKGSILFHQGVHLIESQIKLGLNGGVHLIKVSTL